MTKFIQVILIIWFASFTVFVLVPSFKVLSGIGVPGAADLPAMPDPPKPPTAEELKSSAPAAPVKTPEQPRTKIAGSPATETAVMGDVRDARVNVYTQQVNAYMQQVAAYKSQLESGKTRQVAAYRAVVTDTLVSLLSTALTAFLGFVFVRTGGELVNKYMATKRGQTVESLKIF